MKKRLVPLIFSTFLIVTAFCQHVKADKVPAVVKVALQTKYPEANGVQWEKEKGNYEANWGGNSREDNAVTFTPSGEFVEIEKLITVQQLPAAAANYLKEHYKSARIGEAAKASDAKGKTTYEVSVNKKELVFDEAGKFLSVNQ